MNGDRAFNGEGNAEQKAFCLLITVSAFWINGMSCNKDQRSQPHEQQDSFASLGTSIHLLNVSFEFNEPGISGIGFDGDY